VIARGGAAAACCLEIYEKSVNFLMNLFFSFVINICLISVEYVMQLSEKMIQNLIGYAPIAFQAMPFRDKNIKHKLKNFYVFLFLNFYLNL
jgi:hypothetical protein